MGNPAPDDTRTITKKDLVDAIADEHGMTRASVKTVVHALFSRMLDEIAAGNRLEFRDFGVFEVRQRAARMAQNPKTLERVPVPPKFSVKFKPGRKMKASLEDLAAPPSAGGEIEIKPPVGEAVNDAASR